MPAVSITDLNNAKTDLDKWAEFLHSTAATVTMRNGQVIPTLSGLRAQADANLAAAVASVAAINNRGAWAPATAYAIKDLVSQGGDWYIAVAAHTSAGTFATDQASKWRVYQGVTAAELAATAGAAGVGTTRGGSLAAVLSPLTLLNGGNPSHSDGVNAIVGSARWFLGNAAPSTDDSALMVGRALTGSYAFGAHAFRDETTWQHSGTGLTSYASFDAIPSLTGATAYNHLRGYQSRPEYNGSGSIAELSAFQAQVKNGGAGAVNNAYGLLLADANGAGTITNQYGIYIPALARGASNFALYSASAALPSYHAGRMQFGTPPMISASGFATYGAILAHDTNGQLISNPNLTIINGLLDFKNTIGIAQFWTSGNLKIGVGNNANTTLRHYVPNATGFKHSFGVIATGDGATYTERLAIAADTGHITPGADNTQNLGSASLRFATVYAGSGTINTSDERAKQDIEDIDPAVLRAWSKVKFQQFRFRDAVESKGDGARWHFGVIAQRVKEAFESEGLDPFAYGVLCFDSWVDQWEEWGDEWADHPPVLSDEPDAEGVRAELQPATRTLVRAAGRRLVVAAGDRYGIRYDEALALECAYLRSRLDAA